VIGGHFQFSFNGKRGAAPQAEAPDLMIRFFDTASIPRDEIVRQIEIANN
jgi:hypothetical protein